ncbi:MAG: hypothetical protein HUJ22_03565 [Gracilimonas sp.]|uniref:hypothetical protein n=1 Tax=Gracilimonas sp. TaxID=1974203 RepID=UPI0019A7BAB8|nr:hypothetical protein [Gracilimonas sp.]MBD3615627.1 hypothetical protein [Gracilimonas sp.]
MSNIFKGLFFGIVLVVITGLSACSTSEKTTTVDVGTSGDSYPSWYVPSGFGADSLTFHGFATAVSSDSVIAMANAELQARINLESNIAEKMESVRKELEENGSSAVTNTDFILILRNAHNEVQTAATSEDKSSHKEDRGYRGFAKVSITKIDLESLLKDGFSGHPNYWRELNSSALFAEEIN